MWRLNWPWHGKEISSIIGGMYDTSRGHFQSQWYIPSIWFVYKFRRYLRSSKNNCIFECMIVFIFSGKKDRAVWYHHIKLCVDIPCTWNQSMVHFQGFFALLWTTHFFVQDDIVCHNCLEIHDAIINYSIALLHQVMW